MSSVTSCSLLAWACVPKLGPRVRLAGGSCVVSSECLLCLPAGSGLFPDCLSSPEILHFVARPTPFTPLPAAHHSTRALLFRPPTQPAPDLLLFSSQASSQPIPNVGLLLVPDVAGQMCAKAMRSVVPILVSAHPASNSIPCHAHEGNLSASAPPRTTPTLQLGCRRACAFSVTACGHPAATDHVCTALIPLLSSGLRLLVVRLLPLPYTQGVKLLRACSFDFSCFI